MPRFRAARPATAVPAVAPDAAELSLHERRARAFARVWPLLSTSIPTTDLVESYLDDVLRP
jgi:hypothetical protein